MSDETSVATIAQGAVAVIDALGFKGVWRRNEPTQVIRTLKDIRAAALSDAAFQNVLLSGGWHEGLTVRVFSDTIVLVCTIPPEGAPAKGPPIGPRDVIETVALAAIVITTQAVRRDPALNYRGCIAFGSILAEEEFLVGDAIDNAAEGEHLADAAVLWLHPSALAHYENGYSSVEDPRLVSWQVPLKRGGTRKTLIANPLFLCHVDGWEELIGTAGHVDELTALILASFDTAAVDVTAKRANTANALVVGAQAMRAHYAARGEPPNLEKFREEMLNEARKP